MDYFIIDYSIINYVKTAKKADMQAFVDADLVSDSLDRTSICGYIFIISSGTVYFNSRKQRFIAGSTIETEYIALSLASQQAI